VFGFPSSGEDEDPASRIKGKTATHLTSLAISPTVCLTSTVGRGVNTVQVVQVDVIDSNLDENLSKAT
jgi:hypothetical protein